jgi:bla regulator protein BlaR1
LDEVFDAPGGKSMMRSLTGTERLRERLLRAGNGLAVIFGLLFVGLLDAPQVCTQKTQAVDVPLPSFEVASVKLNKSRTPLPGIHFFDDRFNATMSARGLIARAYGLKGNPLTSDQLSGGPDWINVELYEVNGKIEDSLIVGEWKKLSWDQQRNQVMLMLRSLLADRFKLRVRHETKELSVYALVLDKKGPKFAEDNAHPEIGGLSARGRGKFEATSSDFTAFVSVLSMQPELGGRTVLDKTGLQGHYSFTFQWTPENLTASGGQSAASASSSEASGPSLFTALQEQLGLRLESIKAPVDTIVVEHIERPTEN